VLRVDHATGLDGAVTDGAVPHAVKVVVDDSVVPPLLKVST
jgi:hypothetical protein